jgi:hypothetical protein
VNSSELFAGIKHPNIQGGTSCISLDAGCLTGGTAEGFPTGKKQKESDVMNELEQSETLPEFLVPLGR